MKNLKLSFSLLALFFLLSCEKDETEPEPAFAPTDVLAKTIDSFNINQTFELINSLDLVVENISNGIYTSRLPSDSLSYAENYLAAKTYTKSSVWTVGGHLQIFERLVDIKDKENQKDWLETMQVLQLEEEGTGHTIYFHVPVREEKAWVDRLEKYEFIEWAELNYFVVFAPR